MRYATLLIPWLIACLCTLGCSRSQQPSDFPVPFNELDRPIVDRALALYSGNGKVPMDVVNREVYPVVVHLPKMTCVGLHGRPGMAGGEDNICFNDKTGKVDIYYVDGQ